MLVWLCFSGLFYFMWQNYWVICDITGSYCVSYRFSLVQWLAFYWKSQQRDVPHQICRNLNKISDIAKLLAAVMFFSQSNWRNLRNLHNLQGSFFPLSPQFSSVLMLKIALSLQLLWRKRKKKCKKTAGTIIIQFFMTWNLGLGYVGLRFPVKAQLVCKQQKCQFWQYKNMLHYKNK